MRFRICQHVWCRFCMLSTISVFIGLIKTYIFICYVTLEGHQGYGLISQYFYILFGSSKCWYPLTYMIRTKTLKCFSEHLHLCSAGENKPYKLQDNIHSWGGVIFGWTIPNSFKILVYSVWLEIWLWHAEWGWIVLQVFERIRRADLRTDMEPSCLSFASFVEEHPLLCVYICYWGWGAAC